MFVGWRIYGFNATDDVFQFQAQHLANGAESIGPSAMQFENPIQSGLGNTLPFGQFLDGMKDIE